MSGCVGLSVFSLDFSSLSGGRPPPSNNFSSTGRTLTKHKLVVKKRSWVITSLALKSSSSVLCVCVCVPPCCCIGFAVGIRLVKGLICEASVRKAYSPKMSVDEKALEALGDDFYVAISDLTNNSRPMITSFTLLAQENIDAAEYLTRAVEKRIEKVSKSHPLCPSYRHLQVL